MITAILYLSVLYFGMDASGWIYVLPVFLDMALIDKISHGCDCDYEEDDDEETTETK